MPHLRIHCDLINAEDILFSYYYSQL
uniref:Uncharacterized protein n=1 Tax=Anguilla anguilla TaxID=7936 RepID=A0A0E9VRZ2_ANGAN